MRIPFKTPVALAITFSFSLALTIVSGILIHLSYNGVICDDSLICLGLYITFIIFTVFFSTTSLALLLGLIINLRVSSKAKKEQANQ